MPSNSIEDIKLIIEKHFKKSSISEWKKSEFLKLSGEIKKETNVLISETTLRRIFGKRKTTNEYKPQKATISALTNYAVSIRPRVNQKLNDKKKRVRLRLNYLLVIVVLGLILFIFNLTHIKNEKINSVNITLKSILGKNAASAFFDLNLPKLKTEEYSIYFDDYSDTIPLNYKQNEIGHFYRYPGVFYPKIFHKKQQISDSILVLIPSNDWVGLGTYQHFHIDNSVFPIPKDLLFKPGYLHMTSADLSKVGIDTTEISLLRLFNYQKFEIDGDNLEMSFKLKTINFWPKVFCNNVVLKIKTEHGLIQQYFPKPGCSFWMESVYSDVYKKGETGNLSPFCIDLTDWKTIKVVNENKKLSFYNNDSLIDTIKYKKPLGNLLGIEIHFFGTGFFDDFYLSSYDSSKVFNNHFNNETLDK